MEHVYTLNRGDYAPISFQNGNYFYESFDRISSYLRDKISATDLDRLLKPIIESDNTIKWYANKAANYQRLSELPNQLNNNILTEFHSFLKRTQAIYGPLKSNSDVDKKEWGKMIEELFQPEKIILLGNSNGEWAMLWGWDFRNKEENKLPILDKNEVSETPVAPPIVVPEISNPISDDVHQISSSTNKQTIIDAVSDRIIDASSDTSQRPPISDAPVAGRIGFWGRIKRFLRWVSYRFWGLFWLIIYTLLIILLCRYFFTPDCDDCCRQLENTVNELKRLEEAVKIKCDSIRIVR
jgi:hypothetical protein